MQPLLLRIRAKETKPQPLTMSCWCEWVGCSLNASFVDMKLIHIRNVGSKFEKGWPSHRPTHQRNRWQGTHVAQFASASSSSSIPSKKKKSCFGLCPCPWPHYATTKIQYSLKWEFSSELGVPKANHWSKNEVKSTGELSRSICMWLVIVFLCCWITQGNAEIMCYPFSTWPLQWFSLHSWINNLLYILPSHL